MFYHLPCAAKLLRGQLCTKYTIHWKTFAVHQAVAIMYCTQQVIQGENFRNRLKNHESAKVFPLESFDTELVMGGEIGGPGDLEI